MTAGVSPAGPVNAGLRRRLISLVYEALLLAALLLAGTLPVVLISGDWPHLYARMLLQGWLLLLCGAFYLLQWRGRGQTLPMKTWRMRLVSTRDGAPLSARQALVRYAAACLSIGTLGLGYLWALVDRDHQFLHDRIAGTRLVMSRDLSS